MKKFVIFFYTSGPRDPVFYDTLDQLLDAVHALTKSKAKFAVYQVGECIGDFS